MSKKFSDELISAYLDGELTADEQAEVERALLDSAEHRRTFEELRALRQSLQSLPRFQLDKDFSQRVLRRAERAMLAGGDTRPVDDPPPATTHAPAPAALAKPASSSPATPSSELIRQAAELKRWRRISWASVSVAAASLFVAAMVALRGGQTHNIALTDSMRRYEGSVNFSAPDSVSSPASTATEGTGSGGLAAEEKVLDDDTKQLNAPAGLGGAGHGVGGGLGGPLPPSELRQPMMRREEPRGGAGPQAGGAASPDTHLRLLPADPPPAGAAPPAPTAAPSTASSRFAGQRPSSAARRNAEDDRQPSAAIETENSAHRDHSRKLKESGKDDYTGGTIAMDFYENAALGNPSEVHVIRLHLSSTAFRDGEFYRVLANHDIALVESRGETESLGLADKQDAAVAGKPGEKPDGKQTSPSLNAQVADMNDNGVSEGLEIVLVDAPVEKLAAALKELATQSVANSDSPTALAESRNFFFSQRAAALRERGASNLDWKELGKSDKSSVPAAKGSGGGGLDNRKSADPAQAPGASGGRENDELLARKRLGRSRFAKEKVDKAKDAAGADESKKNEAADTSESLAEESRTKSPVAQARRLMKSRGSDLPLQQLDESFGLESHKLAEKAEPAKKLASDLGRAGLKPTHEQLPADKKQDPAKGDEKNDANRKLPLADRGGRMVRVLFLIEPVPPHAAHAAQAAPAPAIEPATPTPPDK